VGDGGGRIKRCHPEPFPWEGPPDDTSSLRLCHRVGQSRWNRWWTFFEAYAAAGMHLTRPAASMNPHGIVQTAR